MPEPSAPPPSRWRVVERGRRLEVEDRWAAGARAVAPPAASPAMPPAAASANPFGALQRTRFDGGGVLTTRGWYDANGPRTLRLDPGSAQVVRALRLAALPLALGAAAALALVPWLLLPAAFLALRGYAPLRRAVTGWLDRLAREVG